MQNVKKPGSSNLVIGMMLLTSGRFRHITGKISNTEVWELFKDHTCTSFTIKNKIASELAGFGFWQLNLSTAQNYFSKFQPSWWHFCWMTGVNFNSIHYILVRFLHITQFTVCAAKNLTVIVAGSSRCLEWSSMVAVVSRALRELSEPSLGSPGDRRSHSGHVGNTRRRRLITCCRLWPAARRFWLGLHLVACPVSIAPRNKVNFTNYATKLSQNYYTTGFRHFSGNEHPYSVIFKSIFHEKLLQNSGIWLRVLPFSAFTLGMRRTW